MSIVFPPESTALAKKYLSAPIIEHLKHQKTDSGFTLAKAVASGIKNHDSTIGIYAGDAQSYKVFSPVFKPLIQEYHKNSTHRYQSGNIQAIELKNPDPENVFIKSTRIRVARNLAGFNFPCHINLQDRKTVETKIKTALNFLSPDCDGRYFSYETITRQQRLKLKTENLLFEKGDRFQDAAGINTDFPKCRGVFHSSDRTLQIWVNEEDHLRIISIEKTSNLSRTYNRLVAALKNINQHLEFAWDETYGYLTSCPTNIGTTMRAGVHIQLKKLARNKPLLSKLADTCQLQIRGTCGEKTSVENAVFDISNKQRLGISPEDILKNLNAGIIELIQAEKKLL